MKKIAITAGILLLALVILYTPNTPSTTSSEIVDLQTTGHGIANAQEKNVAYIELNIKTPKPTTVNVSWRLVQDPVPETVLLLDAPGLNPNTFPKFKENLTAFLETKGVNLQTVTLQNLESTPPPGILIIATGAIPEQLARQDLARLLAENRTILFIGKPFTIQLNDAGAPSNAKQAWDNQSSQIGIEYYESSSSQPKKHAMRKPAYAVRANGQSNQTQTYSYDDTVYTTKTRGGYLAILPNTLDDGWTTPNQAAQDVTQIILNAEWQKPLAIQEKTVTLQAGSQTVFSPPFDSKTANAILNVQTNASTKRFTFYATALPGSLNNPPEASANQTITFSATLKPEFSQVRQLNLALTAYHNGNQKTVVDLGSAKMEKIGFASASAQLNLDVGDYLLKVQDKNRQTYAQSLLHIQKTTANFLKEDYTGGVVTLQIEKDGQPVPNQAFTISIDDGKNKTLTTDENGQSTFITHVSPKPFHDINIQLQTQALHYQRAHVDASILSNPLILALIAVILVVFGGALMIKVKTKTEYKLDVPDLPPEKTVTTELTAKEVQTAFQKANQKYKRLYLPLTLQEAKDALKEQLQLPNAATLTDYNTQKMLETLEKTGVIQTSQGLYLLPEWAKKSKQTPHFLALKRRTIDQLIKKGRPYTETANGLKTEKTQYVFSEKSLHPKIQHKPATKTVLVFPDRQSMKEYVDKIKNAPDKIAALLYLQLQHQNYAAQTVNDLENDP